MAIGKNRQTEIYVNGVAGDWPVVSTNGSELERQAGGRMSKDAFAYVAGGAGNETTMAANRLALDKRSIVPKMLRNVAERDSSVTLFGKKWPSPFFLCPIGVLEMAHPQADLAVARAAAAEGVPYIISSQASVRMEDTAAEMGTVPRWFQLYWSKNNDLAASFIQRAEACGCEAIVLTLDTTLLGWRTRDLNIGFLPFLKGKGIAQYTSDPVFNRLLEQSDDTISDTPRPRITLNTLKTVWEQAGCLPGSRFNHLKSGRGRKAVQLFTRIFSNPSITWDDLSFIRNTSRLPLILKGIQDADDAKKAVDLGIDGIIVSNHGGRQVDGAVASIDMLEAISKAVGNRCTLLFDSGIRGGADAFKALALGAKAVGIGRPYVYGLAIDGENGVREVVRNFKAEFDLTMGLAGCKNVSEISKNHLKP